MIQIQTSLIPMIPLAYRHVLHGFSSFVNVCLLETLTIGRVSCGMSFRLDSLARVSANESIQLHHELRESVSRERQ